MQEVNEYALSTKSVMMANIDTYNLLFWILWIFLVESRDNYKSGVPMIQKVNFHFGIYSRQMLLLVHIVEKTLHCAQQ